MLAWPSSLCGTLGGIPRSIARVAQGMHAETLDACFVSDDTPNPILKSLIGGDLSYEGQAVMPVGVSGFGNRLECLCASLAGFINESCDE